MKVSKLFLQIFSGVFTVICSHCDEYISREDFPYFDPVKSDKCPCCGAINIIVDG